MSECQLCGLPTPSPPITGSGTDGGFCCRGCLEVARALDDAAASDDPVVEAGDGRDIPEDAAESFLAIDGMHCTTCEVFFDLRGSDLDGVYDVEANYATETARVTYDPDALAEDELPELLSGRGYTARFRDSDGGSGVGRDARVRQRETVQRLVVGVFFAMLIMPWYLFYLYPSYVGIETGILEVDTTTAVGIYLPLAILGLLTTVVLAYTGYPILRGAWTSVRARHPNMDLLVSIAALSAYAYSTVALAMGSTHLYYDVTVAVIVIVTLGRYYEGRIRSQATDLLSSITAARVREATRLTGDGRETVPIDAIDPGDRLVVPPGQRIPLDGTVVDGIADVDESVLTGESLPVTKRPGDEVIGGAVVTDDALIVEVGPEAESTVDRIATTLWGIQSATPGVQRLADRLATVFVPVVLLLGVGVTAWRLAVGETVAASLLAGLTVLVVSCPCAMGLATPLAVSAGLRDALNRGLIVANESVFELVPDVETIVFDKTGTLTEGEMRVVDRFGADETVRLAAAVERRSEHPVADAILAAAENRRDRDADSGVSPRADGGVAEPASAPDPPTDDSESSDTAPSLPDVTAFSRHPGEGVSGTVGNRRVVVGTPALVEDRVGPIPDALSEHIDRIDSDGGLPIVVGWDGRAHGVISIADRPRDGWAETLDAFADREIAIISGDSGASADRFAEHPAVDTVFRGVPPDGKVETVRRLSAGSTTVMVGDGTNDAPALAAADLGIAMGNGTARAVDAGDAVITDGDLTTLETVFEIADGTRRRIRENIGWAFVYNAVAIPLAVAGLLNPLFAAAAMAASSVIVVSNSRRPVC
jgi:Cu2+-exporting ATPase